MSALEPCVVKFTLAGVPPEAWAYRLGNRSAIDWVLDQYKEKKPSPSLLLVFGVPSIDGCRRDGNGFPNHQNEFGICFLWWGQCRWQMQSATPPFLNPYALARFRQKTRQMTLRNTRSDCDSFRFTF
mgnify:CR=1 FL=1